MKKSMMIAVVFLFSLSLVRLSAAETEAGTWFGNITAGYHFVDENSDNQARFLEYRDLDDDLILGVVLGLRQDDWLVDFRAADIGTDDQEFDFQVANYGNFAADIFYHEFTHSLSLDALAPYNGIGGSELTTGVELSQFDYDIERREYGGEFNVSFGTPFYLNMSLQRRQEEGLRPLGSGNYWFNLELPEPVDYTTDDLSLALGYRGRRLQAEIKGFWSDFDNDHENLTRPLDGTVIGLAPDNDYGKISAQMSLRQLPLDSLLALRFSYAKLDSEVSLKDLGLDADDFLRRSFDGDITYTRASLALSSRPLARLDTRLYFSYLDKDNDSSPVSLEHAEQLFSFREYCGSAEAGWQLLKSTRLSSSYEYRDIDRKNLLVGEENHDHSFVLELKDNTPDFLVSRLSYKHRLRDGDGGYYTATDPVLEGDDWIRRYLVNYDVADQDLDEIRLAFEVYPLENLDLGLSYAYRLSDYDDNELGLTKDRRHEVYADFIWRPAEKISLGGHVGYEMSQADSSHRQFGAGESADISSLDGSAFNWQQESKADYWSCGLNFDWRRIFDKLDLSVGWQYHQSDGEIDYSAAGQSLADIDEADDYDLQKLDLKISYTPCDYAVLTLGYSYERFDGEDVLWSDYDAFRADGEVFGSYLTGAGFDDDYRVNLAYLMVSYKF